MVERRRVHHIEIELVGEIQRELHREGHERVIVTARVTTQATLTHGSDLGPVNSGFSPILQPPHGATLKLKN